MIDWERKRSDIDLDIAIDTDIDKNIDLAKFICRYRYG